MRHNNRNKILEPRPQVRSFESYQPGRSMEQVKKEFGLKSIVKLASNENPLGPSPQAVAAMRKCVKAMFIYPDGFSTNLRLALAKDLGVRLSQVTLGAGSDEVIETLGKTFLEPRDNVVVSEHAFIRYRMAAELMGSRVVEVPMKNYTHDLAAMARAVNRRTKFVFVVNPNNPTGTYSTTRDMKHFLKALPPTAIAVIDEAYFEYARLKKDYPDSLSYFKRGQPLIALRTFSKIHGLAGARLGYAVAPESIVKEMERVRPPFNISLTAQTAGVAALRDKNQIRRSLRLIRTEKPRLERALQQLGILFIPSAANFILFHVGPMGGRKVFDALLRRGVIVRSMDEYGFPHHVRVTVGLPHENEKFLKALENVMRGREDES